MKNKFLSLILLLTVSGAIFFIYVRRDIMLRNTLTFILNKSADEYFQGSIRLKSVELDRSFKLKIEGFEGVLKTEQGFFPVEIGWVKSRGAVPLIFSKEGLLFDFKNVRPRGSSRKGVHGDLQLYAGREWFSKLRLDIEALDLEDIQWLDPNDLTGSNGEMKGSVTFVSNYKKEIGFYADLKISEPGGLLQERFFESLKPYLPAVTQIKGKIKRDGRDMVSFRTAHLNVRLLDSDTVIGLFQIQIPEYNIILNLNLTVKLDEKNGFSQLFDIMSLIKVKS